MNIATLNAKSRKGAGKGAARAIRREGLLPAVIYGDKKEPVLIAISEKDFGLEMKKKGFWTRQYEINVDGEKYRGICQDVQNDPVTDRLMHVDFLRISKDSEISIEVPVVFLHEDTCPGLKLGGVLNVVARTIEVICRPDDIPQSFEIDLANMNMNESVHSDSLVLPKGVRLADANGFAIASITPPANEKADTAPAAAAAAAAPAAAAAAAAPAAAAAQPADKK